MCICMCMCMCICMCICICIYILYNIHVSLDWSDISIYTGWWSSPNIQLSTKTQRKSSSKWSPSHMEELHLLPHSLGPRGPWTRISLAPEDTVVTMPFAPTIPQPSPKKIGGWGLPFPVTSSGKHGIVLSTLVDAKTPGLWMLVNSNPEIRWFMDGYSPNYGGRFWAIPRCGDEAFPGVSWAPPVSNPNVLDLRFLSDPKCQKNMWSSDY